MHLYTSVRINGGAFTAQACDAAQDSHSGIGEGFEVAGVDAGGGFCCHCGGDVGKTANVSADRLWEGGARIERNQEGNEGVSVGKYGGADINGAGAKARDQCPHGWCWDTTVLY